MDTKTSYILKIHCRPLYLDILPIIIFYLKHLSWKIINKFLMLQITSEIQIINHFQYFSACFLPKGSSSPIMPVVPDAWLEHSENLTMNKKSGSGQNCQAYEEDWILPITNGPPDTLRFLLSEFCFNSLTERETVSFQFRLQMLCNI